MATITDKPVILVVDDSRVMRKAMIKILGDGYEVIEAEDGMKGWNQVLGNSSIEVVISDIEMPNMDGYSFICRIRASEDEALRNIPVIVITGAEDDITRERAYACGANDFILKPIDKQQMLSCVNAHLEKAPEEEQKTDAPVDLKVHQGHRGDGSAEMPDLESALKVLRSPHPHALDNYALNLALRVMPVLDYCNRRFKLGLDEEILSVKRRILEARMPARKKAAG
jgi:CheY-like chemotaxis protein